MCIRDRNGREFLALAGLVPGAYTGTRPLDNPVPAKAKYVVGYNGARGTSNSFYLDGGANTSPYYNNMISSPSVEAIQEFRVETDQYSARYGQAGGAIVSVVTRSGTNAFHGSLYEYHRNKVLDARPYFFRGTRREWPKHLWNQYGGSLGGPIRKNKLFFFGNAEFFPQRDSVQKISFAPTAAERIGDVRNSINPWSGQPVVLTDPYTGQVIPSGILPDSFQTPVGKKLMSLWPDPNYPQNPAFNYRVFRPVVNTIHKYTGRVDAILSSQDSLAGTFNYGNADIGVPGFIDFGDKVQSDHDRTATVRYTRTFSPTLVSVSGLTYNQDLLGDRFRLANGAGVQLGMDPTYNSNQAMPWILLFTQGSQFFTPGAAGDNKTFTYQGQIYSDFSWQRGRHTVQLGGLYWRQWYKWQFFSGSSQYFVNLIDGVAPGTWPLFGVTGSAFTNLLAGLYNLGVFGGGGGQYQHFLRDTYGLYVQDAWRLKPRLMLNLGLRWDYERPFKVSDGKYLSLDNNTGLIRYAKGAPGLSTLQFKYLTDGPDLAYRGHPLSFAPRFGLAWQPFPNDSFVVRSGYGIFDTSEAAFVMQPASFANPFGGPTVVWEKKILGGWPDSDHLRPFSQPPYGVEIKRSSTPGCCFVFTDSRFPRSYMQQWNLALGRKLVKDVVGELAYVGSHGVNLSSYIPLEAYSTDLYNKFIANYGGGVKPPVRLKGFDSTYNALQVSARRNTDHGLTILAAYTYSHALADSSNDTVTENTAYNSVNGVNKYFKIRGNAGYDVRQRFTVSSVYELPLGRGRRFGESWNRFLNSALGGWKVNAIFTAQSGFPFNVLTPGNVIPDRTCNGNLPKDKRTIQRWFDYTCFPTHNDPATGQPSPGNAGVNQIYGPGINNWDMGIHKTFDITEGKTLQFRLENFNIWNHPQFLGPVSGNWFNNTKESAEIGNARDSRQIQLALRFAF